MLKKLTLSVLAVAMVAALASAATYALFTDTTTNTNNTFSAGTVKLGAPTTTLANVSDVAPGDSGSATYAVKYIGSLQAWEGLNASLSGTLSTCSGNAFTLTISDGAKSYTANGAQQVVGLVNQNDSKTFTVNWSLPMSADNTCQGASATITLSVQAVQAKNNTNAGNTGPLSWS